MTATLLNTGDEHRQRRAHIKAYVGEVGDVRVRRTANGGWHHDIACNQCPTRWWKEGPDASELIAAWLMHEAGHGSDVRRRMALAAKGEITRDDGDQFIRGISHLVALALTVMDIDVVRRATIRALLPASGNSVSSQANRAYRTFEKAGWITRLPGGLIRVLDRESLFGWVTNSRDLDSDRAINMLSIGVAAKALTEESVPASRLAAEVRLQELRALQRLMESAPGVLTNKRGAVRVVPKSRPL